MNVFDSFEKAEEERLAFLKELELDIGTTGCIHGRVGDVGRRFHKRVLDKIDNLSLPMFHYSNIY